MRSKLLYNPRLLCERLATESVRRRRLAGLRGTRAAGLALGHIDTLELVELASEAGIGVIFDIGANVGTWSLLAQSLIPGARIHAFEPLPKHQIGFRNNFRSNEDVTLHPIALGSTNASAMLHVTDLSDASSFLQLNAPCMSQFGVQEVAQFPLQVFRLDDYRLEKQLPMPDLVKLDIQGYELEALKGGSKCLTAAKAIIAEVSFIEYYSGQCLFHDLVTYLAEFGLFARAFGINTPTGRPIGQTDVLFTRKCGTGVKGVRD